MIKYIKGTYPHAAIELPDLFSGKLTRKCGWGVHRCEIMANGDVTSCGPIEFNKSGFVASNIHKSPLKDIGKSEHFNYIRNLKQENFEGLCSKCIFWKGCLGACRSVSYANSDHLLAPHPFCNLVFDGVKKGKIDPSLLLDKNRTFQWISEIDSPDYIPESMSYKDIVINQHDD